MATAVSTDEKWRYAVGVVVLVAAIASQYVVPVYVVASRPIYHSLAGDVLIVYGLPIATFAALLGPGPLRHWHRNLGTATVQGLGWFGATALLALGVTIALGVAYLSLDPGALKLLERPNPALEAAVGNPWFYVGFSFVVGACEETIFRGWVYGFWSGRTASWVTPALLTSVLFASVHLYYGTTYGIAAPLIFPTLFLLGFGFAATYEKSGGNLVVPAALHGAYDATAYLTLISLTIGTDLHWALILVGALVGLLYYLRLGGAGASVPARGPLR